MKVFAVFARLKVGDQYITTCKVYVIYSLYCLVACVEECEALTVVTPLGGNWQCYECRRAEARTA